jgi:3',5'-cyclic AMP phosphodiesterase CpdA
VRKLQWAGVLAGTALLILLSVAGLLDHESQMDLLSTSRNRLVQHPEFRVGVLGDSQKGLANLRNITRTLIHEKVSLLLHTGDLVSTNDEGHYLLALRYLAKGGGGHLPVAPGNHDVKGGAERFQRRLGPLEQSFGWRGVAFVILDNAHGTPPSPAHIEKRIAAAGPHQAVVLAMHQPPFDLKGEARPEYAAFLAWLERSKVAYLLCGHVHAYMKKKVGETTVIINGVGGDYDSWQLRQKVYATILEIDGSMITDRTIEIDPVHEVWENVEHFAVGHVAESYRQNPVLCWLGTVLLAGAVGWGWVRIFRRPREPFRTAVG